MYKQIECNICEGGEYIHLLHYNDMVEEISIEYDEAMGQMVKQSLYISDTCEILVKEKIERCPKCGKEF